MLDTRPSLRRLRTAATCLAAVVALSACTAGEAGTSPERGPSEGVPVVQPGSPGETASAVPPQAGASVSSENGWNHADVAFLQMMIPHHAQALQMSRVARSRAAAPQVRRLAARIRAAQGPEILTMASWLAERKMEVPEAAEDPMSYDHSQHGHDGMAGMLTPARMRELEAARGRHFDRLFLHAMIRHHQGAVEMANRVAGAGVDLTVSQMAADVFAAQTAEISRMRDMLRQM